MIEDIKASDYEEGMFKCIKFIMIQNNIIIEILKRKGQIKGKSR